MFIESGASLSRRGFFRYVFRRCLEASAAASGKELIIPIELYGSLTRDLPVYRQIAEDSRISLPGVFFPKGSLLRFNRLSVGYRRGMAERWLTIENDSWVHDPKALRAQRNLVVPYTWGEVAFVTERDVQPINSLSLDNLVGKVSPDDKRIEIDLAAQTLYAFEKDGMVLTSLVSSGLWGLTPKGEFTIFAKRLSRYMQGAGFDLPGVPYTCYFTDSGIALHGAYWHEKFGQPMSHGCINLPIPVAETIFRWSSPVANYHEEMTFGFGTKVIIY